MKITAFEISFVRCYSIAIFVIVGLCMPCSMAFGQESAAGGSAKERYEKAVAKGRELAKKCRNISVRFFDGSLAKSYEWKDKWDVAAKELADQKSVIEDAVVDWFFECEDPDESLVQIAAGVSSESYRAGDFELTWKLMEKVRKYWPNPNDAKLLRTMALVAIKTNRFDYALNYIQNHPEAAAAIEELEGQLDKNMFILCPQLAEDWNVEKEIRKKEAVADDLPLVKLELSTGEVVVELFENEAPNTVANFINLVESGHYSDSVFHPVLKDIAAQTGIYSKTRKAPTSYVIENEGKKPNARHHFAGSLSMVSIGGGKHSSSSVFAFTQLPNPDLDWDGTEEDTSVQTVFGRVVSGMSAVAAIPATVEIDAETKEQKDLNVEDYAIIKNATVIRKRDHEYNCEKAQSKDYK